MNESNLAGVIRFWESIYQDRGLLSPDTQYIIKVTIESLKKLMEVLKGEEVKNSQSSR